MKIFSILFAIVSLSGAQLLDDVTLPAGVTLPPGIVLPPGFTFPPDFKIPDLNDLPDEYVGVHQALIIPRGSNASNVLCNGVLLLNFTIITAASCLMKNDNEEFYDPSELSVALGFYSIEDVMVVEPQIFEVRKIIFHGRFNKKTLFNNIAMLKLDGEIKFSKTIVPLIPANAKVTDGMECIVVGWNDGKTEAIRTFTKSRRNCMSLRGEESSWPLESFCSSFSNDGDSDECLASEGSALICNRMLQGIISTSDCSVDGKVTVITDFSQFFYWSFINQLDENPYRLMDNEQVRYVLFGALDFIAWYSKNPKIADLFEVVKFFF